MMLKALTKNNNKGLTLIEVLLAISILSTGIVGVLRAYAKALDSLEAGRDNIDFIFILKEKMGDIEQDVMNNGGFIPEKSNGSFSGDFDDFSWELKNALLAEGRLEEVSLLVRNDNSKRQLAVSTYFAPYIKEQ